MKYVLPLIICFNLFGCKSINRVLNGVSNQSNSDTPIVNTIQPYHNVIVAAGQSNMTGIDSDSLEYNPNVEILYADGRWPRNGMSYAYGLERAKAGHIVTIIMCAEGGSSIDRWQPGGDLYNRCLGRIYNSGLKPTAIFFSQGEQEATNPIRIEWKDAFISFIQGMRQDLNNSNIPIFFTQLGPNLAVMDYGSHPPINYQWVKDQQASVHWSFTYMIEADGLSHSNGWHYTTSSQIELGHRFNLTATRNKF